MQSTAADGEGKVREWLKPTVLERAVEKQRKLALPPKLVSFFYILLMLYDDERVVELWFERMSQSLDPELALFEEIYRELTQGYINVQFRMANEGMEVQELQRLQQRVKELQAENNY